MNDPVAAWGLIVGVLALAVSTATLWFVVGDWRTSRSIFCSVTSPSWVPVEGFPSRTRRVIELSFTAATNVLFICPYGATPVEQRDPEIDNKGNRPGPLDANERHVMLMDSPDWAYAWVQITFLRPRSKQWIVAWAPLGDIGESELRKPSAPIGALTRIRWLGRLRFHPEPVGPGYARLRIVKPGRGMAQQLATLMGTQEHWQQQTQQLRDRQANNQPDNAETPVQPAHPTDE